ncbi:uncharacterized protein PGTG_13203 [Puccinia graminis f. sp. tritici CRL 75-36-700-3]|uniref:Metallo-beta-lactamase domain-containing protein n=1 Tax=Puccinia graminis f. sp. tritici (strain CRL 75-36-700-3 / race SCCL) TaxID=418459 RepID=E3KR96_PUCGT|nr:uncharacterized protein PGTG_13203 [Puccinia graminis f. sp. tritici CRL 75-36-700-3]EFP86821.2 hypothetical protein PGTG_13203 [Puccinia graminis f. sp. tritici CRL 75-36-700-3]
MIRNTVAFVVAGRAPSYRTHPCSKIILVSRSSISGTRGRRNTSSHPVGAGSMEEEAAQIPDVSVVGSGITRILGQNPGPYTLQGTNTYLIAGEKASLLIDTGEGKESYVDLLEPVLRSNPPVSDIILTHRHRDHVAGLSSVLKLISSLDHPSGPSPMSLRRMPKVWKFPSDGATYDLDIRQSIIDATDPSHLHPQPGPSDSSEKTPPLKILSEHQEFPLSAHSKLQILHTPGHTEDSISCLLFEDPERRTDSSKKPESLSAIFVGDTILGGSSTIFEDLITYLRSLHKLLRISTTTNRISDSPVRLFPGHGPLIQNGPDLIQRNIDHRLAREKQILDCFRLHPSSQPSSGHSCVLTAEKLIELMYPVGLPKAVYPAALRGVHQHLHKLRAEGLVDRWPSDSTDQLWRLTDNNTNKST